MRSVVSAYSARARDADDDDGAYVALYIYISSCPPAENISIRTREIFNIHAYVSYVGRKKYLNVNIAPALVLFDGQSSLSRSLRENVSLSIVPPVAVASRGKYHRRTVASPVGVFSADRDNRPAILSCVRARGFYWHLARAILLFITVGRASVGFYSSETNF